MYDFDDSHCYVNNFRPTNSQSIFSCKRKATRILEQLLLVSSKPTISLLDEGFIPEILDISYIFAPYHLRIYFFGCFRMYALNRSLPMDTVITRGLLLDFLSVQDGYPNWETFRYKLKENPAQSNKKTYVLSCDLKDSFDPYKVKVFFDNPDHKHNGQLLYNPAKEFGYSPVGYSWGYEGSSVRELATALLFSVNPDLVQHSTFMRRKFLSEFPQDKNIELIITEDEIVQFIESTENRR